VYSQALLRCSGPRFSTEARGSSSSRLISRQGRS
jgi:hypothetical protein